MPSFLTQTFASYFKRILQINQTTNTGVDATPRNVQTGDGVGTPVWMSDDTILTKPINDNTITTFAVVTASSENVLVVDTLNKLVKIGESQVSATTLFKEMGLYDFTPAAGYHYPLVANTMHFETAFAADNDWGNGADPATSLDVSGLTAQENAIAVYWYLENDITLDAARWMATADGSSNLTFHLFSYDIDTSSNHGDLSNGVVNANAVVAPATATAIKTGTFTLDAADIDAGKVVVGFVENISGTDDISVSFNIKYHIR